LFTEKLPVLTADKAYLPEEKTVVVITEGGRPVHVGIYAGNGFILHTNVKTNSICQKTSHPGLTNRIEGYYHVC
jgi:hypothetical protein